MISNFKKQNILIVEDDFTALTLMVELFESKFGRVYSAQDGIEAIEIFKESDIDVILCDINLPKLNGLDTIDVIRKMNYLVPIIIISAFSDKSNLLRASNSNIQGYIIKPISYSEIKNILEKIALYQKHNQIKNSLELNENLIINLDNSIITRNEETIELTNNERDFLKLLLKNRGQLVTYKYIESEMWIKKGKSMSDVALRTLVKNLRKKLGNEAIKTIPKLGYKVDI